MVHRICIIPGIMGHLNGPSCLRQTPYLGASTTFHFGVFRIDRIDSVHGNWGMSHLNFYSHTSAPPGYPLAVVPPPFTVELSVRNIIYPWNVYHEDLLTMLLT